VSAKTMSPAETIAQLSRRGTSLTASGIRRRRSGAVENSGVTTRPISSGHKLHVGQTVTLLPTHYGANRNGNFKVTCLLPQERGVHQYRLKSVTDGHERVATEDELS
jgi:hypothetical protein